MQYIGASDLNAFGNAKYYCGLFDDKRFYRGEYSLARDAELLKYIADFKDKIDFVVFMGGRGCVEVINTASIADMLPLLGCDFSVVPVVGCVSTIASAILERR